MLKNTVTIPPALLLSSCNVEKLNVYTKNLIASHFCKQHTSTNQCSCRICDKIRMHQHHSIRWFSPDKRYLVEDIEQVIDTTSLLLQNDTHFFFVFEHAERLGAASGNRLLKTIEEPPDRYHFIFLTTNPNEVLPTIVSRCMQKIVGNKSSGIQNNLIMDAFLSELNYCLLVDFEKILKSTEIDHIQSRSILDQLVLTFFSLHHKTLNQKEVKYKKHVVFFSDVIELLQTAQKRPPMPGSHEIFWKQLYLSFSIIRTRHKTLFRHYQ